MAPVCVWAMPIDILHLNARSKFEQKISIVCVSELQSFPPDSSADGQSQGEDDSDASTAQTTRNKVSTVACSNSHPHR